MSSSDFVKLVQNMRHHQTAYFKSKDKRHLVAACQLEKQVDRTVKVKLDLIHLFPAMREDGVNTDDLNQLRADNDRLTEVLAIATDLLAECHKLDELKATLLAHGL